MLKNFVWFFKIQELLKLDLVYFLKGGFWIGLGLVITTIGGIILSYLFAKIWPLDVYGQYSFLISTIGFLSITVAPGLAQVVTQEVAEGKDGIYPKAIKTAFKFSVFGLLALLLGSLYFFIRNNHTLALATFLCAFAFPFASGLNLYLPFLNGKKEFKKYALANVISQSLFIVVSAITLLLNSNFIVVVVISLWSTALINILLTYLSLKMIKNKDYSPSSISFGLHISVSHFINFAGDYAERFLIPLMLGFNIAAIYAFATIIPNQLNNLFKIFLNLAQPKIASIKKINLKSAVYKKSLQLEILIIFVTLFYILVSPMIFDILYPKYKETSLFISQIYALILLYYPANLIGLAILKQQSSKSMYKLNISYNLISISLLVLFIHLFGLLGVVYAKLISKFIAVILSIHLIDKLTSDV